MHANRKMGTCLRILVAVPHIYRIRLERSIQDIQLEYGRGLSCDRLYRYTCGSNAGILLCIHQQSCCRPLQRGSADAFARECFLYCPNVLLKVGHARLNFLELADALL